MSDTIGPHTHVTRGDQLRMDRVHGFMAEAWPQPVREHDPFDDAPFLGGSALSRLIDTSEVPGPSVPHAAAA